MCTWLYQRALVIWYIYGYIYGYIYIYIYIYIYMFISDNILLGRYWSN